ncbi:hypothetical protein O181_057391 [Austropuccinia psidii MF-1]|uniref:Peptide-methionine (R)-S-oxide reductase n=1 Tax=Austropuccinia psidii MF-1 TaxID=1389203 RepID=A0A9Q3HTV8_9BASI|nr:hypothetical protein [Austropuccinia psidii MF-1]
MAAELVGARLFNLSSSNIQAKGIHQLRKAPRFRLQMSKLVSSNLTSSIHQIVHINRLWLPVITGILLSGSFYSLFKKLSPPSSLRSSFSTLSISSQPSASCHSLKEKLSPSGMSDPLPKTEEEWRLKLTPEQFRILRLKGTESAGTGKYNNHQATQGVYECAGCGAPLYRFDHKFNSGCGWPAFFDAIPGAVSRTADRKFGILRTEITCTNCGGHLGHVFEGEGYGYETDERHCVNSVSIKFNEQSSAPQNQTKQ